MSGRPPIVVLLGGPSAEHDVSIVSGTAIADALADAGYDVEQVVIDLDGQWWWLPPGHRRDGRPVTDYDDPASLGRAGPMLSAPPSTGWPARDRHRSCSSRCTGRSARTGRSRRMLEAAGVAYTGSGVAASAIGMDKTLFKRLCRGSACRSSTGARSGRTAGRRTSAGVRAELDAFAAAAEDRG